MKRIISICLCFVILVLPTASVFAEKKYQLKNLTADKKEIIIRQARKQHYINGLSLIGAGISFYADSKRYSDNLYNIFSAFIVAVGIREIINIEYIPRSEEIGIWSKKEWIKNGLYLTGCFLVTYIPTDNAPNPMYGEDLISTGRLMMLFGIIGFFKNGLFYNPIFSNKNESSKITTIVYPNYVGIALSKRF